MWTIDLYAGYGMTEASPIIFGSTNTEQPHGSVGILIPNSEAMASIQNEAMDHTNFVCLVTHKGQQAQIKYTIR